MPACCVLCLSHALSPLPSLLRLCSLSCLLLHLHPLESRTSLCVLEGRHERLEQRRLSDTVTRTANRYKRCQMWKCFGNSSFFCFSVLFGIYEYLTVKEKSTLCLLSTIECHSVLICFLFVGELSCACTHLTNFSSIRQDQGQDGQPSGGVTVTKGQIFSDPSSLPTPHHTLHISQTPHAHLLLTRVSLQTISPAQLLVLCLVVLFSLLVL